MVDPSILSTLASLADLADIATTRATTGGQSYYDWDVNVKAAKDSYSKFWNIQTASQPDADAGQNATINALNARVHAAWGRLETWLAHFDDPSTWAGHAATATEAMTDAQNLSAAASQSARQQASYGQQIVQAQNAPVDAQKYYIDTSYGKAFSDQVGKITDTLSQGFLGVPLWAWGVAALGSIYLLVKRP